MTTAGTVRYATHPDSNANWYDPVTRRQVVEIEGANGQMKRPTLKEARVYGWYPGISAITNCASSFGLENWIREKVARSAVALAGTKGDAEEEKAFYDRILAHSEQERSKPAAVGTEIHKHVQRWFDGHAPEPGNECYVTGAMAALEACLGKQDLARWKAEDVVVHPAGYGTKIDAYSPEVVVDWKSKDGDLTALLNEKLWPKHWMQLAAGNRAIGDGNTRRCFIGFISRTHKDAHGRSICVLAEAKRPELIRGIRMFDALLTYWREDRNYFPGYAETEIAQ